MHKVFEVYFSDYQADMVSICLQYVDNRADKIFIYCSCEDGIISSNYFYCINGRVVKKHRVNDALDKTCGESLLYDTSDERQMGVLDILTDNVEKLEDLCKEYGHEMPTEIKLIYDVKKNSLTANYKYDLVYSKHKYKTSDDIENEWFEQIRQGINNIPISGVKWWNNN